MTRHAAAAEADALPAAKGGRLPFHEILLKYQSPNVRKAIWQIANSVIPYVVLWALMIWSLEVSYWLTFPLAMMAAGFLTRIFIIQHDCGHGAFFKSARANDLLGMIFGVLTFTPYYHWRHEHAVHHATAGHLDRRGMGDVRTLTVDEYFALSPARRFLYRFYRHPLMMFGLGPIGLFFLRHRFVNPQVKKRRERRSVYATNLGLLAMFALGSAVAGFPEFVLLQLLVMYVAGIAGIWLFFVQHQYENSYWQRAERWDYATAALKGSSYYRLPKVLQFFSGNIGLHHIHHLNPRIANYHLQQCQDDPEFRPEITVLTLRTALPCMKLALWDERTNRMVGFSALRRRPLAL